MLRAIAFGLGDVIIRVARGLVRLAEPWSWRPFCGPIIAKQISRGRAITY
jgi:hypothetical protein